MDTTATDVVPATVDSRGSASCSAKVRDPCPWCHRVSRRACCVFAITGGLKSFAAAYGIKAGLAILLLLIKGRLNLRSLGQALLGLDSLRLGAVVGLMSTITRALRCLLSRIRRVDDKANAFVSALVGGCASALDDPSRRSGLGVYLLCRALYSVAHTGLRLGALPRLPGALVALFAFANTGILYAFAYEPHLLDRAYYQWMMNLTLLNHEKLQWTLRDPRLARQQLKRCSDASVALPSVSGSSWGEGSNPGVSATGLAGRLTLPSVSLYSLDDALGRGPGRAQAIIDGQTWCSAHGHSLLQQQSPVARAPHLTHSASNALKRDLAIPFEKALLLPASSVSGVPIEPRWVHAALVSQVQRPDAFRHCDVAWHRGKPCMQAHALEVIPILLR